MKVHNTFLHKKRYLFFGSQKVEIGYKCERETETKDSDESWRSIAILTVFLTHVVIPYSGF